MASLSSSSLLPPSPPLPPPAHLFYSTRLPAFSVHPLASFACPPACLPHLPCRRSSRHILPPPGNQLRAPVPGPVCSRAKTVTGTSLTQTDQPLAPGPREERDPVTGHLAFPHPLAHFLLCPPTVMASSFSLPVRLFHWLALGESDSVATFKGFKHCASPRSD